MQTIQTLRHPTVAAFGEWSQTNIGDHAIHEGVQEFFGTCDWRVRSFDLGALRSASGPRPGVDDLPGAPSVLDIMPGVKRALRGWRQQVLIRQLLPKLTDCDAICVGGGALLMDSNLHFPQSLEALTWAARQLDKPLLCLGCSVEGGWSAPGQRIVHDFLANCAFVALRDRASAERVSALLGRRVPVFGDFALPMRAIHATEAPSRVSPQYLLAVNATHVPMGEGESQRAWQQRYEDGLVELITAVAAQARTKDGSKTGIAVFTTGTAQDVAPATRVCARLTSVGATLHIGRSLEQLRELLHASRMVVAARLHAAIISLAEHIPVVGYSATSKLGNFFHSVGLVDCHFGPGDATVLAVNDALRVMHEGQRFSASACITMQRTREAAREFLTTPVRQCEVASL